MRRQSLRVVLAALVGVLGIVLPLRGQAQPVTVAMGLNKPPYVMDGGTSGLEVDIAREALAAVGLTMRPQQLPPARGLMLHRAGQIDILLTVDEGIGGDGFFSEPYINYQNVAMSLSANKLSIKRIEDLSSYSVGAFQNASMILGERFAAVARRHARYQEYPQQVIQNNLLFTERVDVIVGDKRILHYLSSQLDAKVDVSKPVTVHPIFPLSPRKAVFKDAALRDQFNTGLKLIQANGVYDGILKKYANFQ
ncbi:substrate-binding periplasmic protein [Rhodoferax mekongensis]|uniref:Transporter substrate-binding domain-containing protein n=1 Tax=Rhodoferax mekongensis TaxID=3068341 RepID=A0ABZ0AVJ3_9BURK|nr:transporter substrate-binding domain-containing protein [Rhodoferax sp. TBRC 17307]WNO03659.1 transporter substrate-binding domain-containing protein [Rhodoferax sp. TBRC 17307]